jgi:hypothetical protein
VKVSGVPSGDEPVHHLYLAGPGRDPAGPGSGSSSAGPDWIATLAHEMQGRADRTRLDPREIASLHLGDAGWDESGPSLAEAVRERLLAGHLPRREFAVELDVPRVEDLRQWKSDGVTRVNLRKVPEAKSILAEVGSIGFRSWGVDVAFGGEAGLRARSRRALERVTESQVPHVSLVERDGPANPDRVAAEYLLFTDLLHEAGYDPWEMTCFARAGHIPTHVSAVHRGEAYIGLGPGAHSRMGVMRRWNHLDPSEYLNAMDRGRDPLEQVEELNADERRIEYLVSGLRLSGGIPGSELPPAIRSLRDRWEADGMAVPDRSRLRLTPRGWLLLDTLVLELALELERLDSG